MNFLEERIVKDGIVDGRLHQPQFHQQGQSCGQRHGGQERPDRRDRQA